MNFFKKIFTKDWILVESGTAVWNLTHGAGGGIEQYFCFYKIMYSPSKNYYTLKTSGYRAKEHRMYGQMLFRVAQLNSGQPFEDLINVEVEKDAVVITQFSLTYTADRVFSYIKEDKELVDAITNVKNTLKKQGVEVFEQNHNIIATDKGYYGAFWEKDLEVEGEQDTDNEIDLTD